jgi:hypothetical protein
MQNSLEPRLIKYLKAKKMLKEKGLTSRTIESDFEITKNDIEIIKFFYHNKKINSNTGHADFINPNPKANGFKSITEQHDARLDKIKAKQQKDKEANDQRQNYDIISRGFDMYRNDRHFASATGNDFKSKFDPQEWMDSGSDDEDENPNKQQIRHNNESMAKTNVYKNVPPKIKYNIYTPYGNNTDLNDNSKYSLDSIISNMDSYKEKNKRDQENNYKAVPLMNGKLRDVNTDNYLNYGDGQLRSKKTRGYPNPVEHYYSYISDDIQDPNHVVFDQWIDTRRDNKKIARPYSDMNNRDIMM